MITCSSCSGRLAYKGMVRVVVNMVVKTRHSYECKKCGKWWRFERKLDEPTVKIDRRFVFR